MTETAGVPPYRQPAVGSRMMLACRDTGLGGIATRLAGLHAADRIDAAPPVGVSVAEFCNLPAIFLPFSGLAVGEIHQSAIGRAWQEGAWDVELTFHPPYEGAQLGIVTAGIDYTDAEAAHTRLIDAARVGRLATWAWRPMRGGPALRLAAHAKRDITLLPDGGRHGAPSDDLPQPIWAWRDSRTWTIRLGRTPEAAKRSALSYVRRATPRQRSYIVALRWRHALDVGAPLPASLSSADASAMIKSLLGRAAAREG